MENLTLSQIEKLVQQIDKDLYIDTGSQSFVVYPTNYINVVSETKFNLCIGEIVYGNIALYKEMFDNLETLVSLLGQVDDSFIIHIDYNTTFDLTIYFLGEPDGGDYDDLQSFYCDDIQDLISTIKRETMQ